jgi:DNA-directed RNA polymerase subunit RPC12/RpoP
MSTRTIKQKTCLRCGRTWWPKTPERPRACPTCRSAYWDKERVYKQRNVNKGVTGDAGGGVP